MKEALDNSPELWRFAFPVPKSDSHKYSRGTALIRGGAVMTGAARLAARAAQRIGAGLVTIAAPISALPIYAECLESVIVRPCDNIQTWKNLIDDAHHPALLIGPGLGAGHEVEIQAALAAQRPTVLDADALQEILLGALHDNCVLTPHEGEFTRTFGESSNDKITRTRNAATRAGCVVLLKGEETIIAAPKGDIVINRTGSPWLATAGSGDVLSGMILGLLAQGMDVFHASCAAAWLHGRIGTAHGAGLIAEDIVDGIPAILHEIIDI